MQDIEEYSGIITARGQITLPSKIRRLLGVKPHDKIVFKVSEGRVELQTAGMTLEDSFGAVTPISRPEDFKALRDIAIEEHVQKVI